MSRSYRDNSPLFYPLLRDALRFSRDSLPLDVAPALCHDGSSDQEKESVATQETLAAQIRGLEAQLAVLSAQMKRLGASASSATFASLYGLLAGKVESTEEDIDNVLFQFKEDVQSTGADE
jgi:hypothetical protein